MSAPATTTPEVAPEATAKAPLVLSSDQGFWTIAWRQFKKDRVSMGGLATVALLISLAVFAPFLANGRPYAIHGILTNFYANDVAAWSDWHRLYRERVDVATDPARPQLERLEAEQETERYRAGLPAILERIEDYLKPEDAKALDAFTTRYRALVRAPLASFDREQHEALGREFQERFGALALEPAYKQVSGPLVELEFGRGGEKSLRKRGLEAAQEARDAKEDGDAKAQAKAEAKLAALAPDLEALARRVETGTKSIAGFLDEKGRTDLEAVAKDLGTTIRAFAAASADDALVSKLAGLSARVDAFARVSVPPERQSLPRVVRYPVFEYLQPSELFFVVVTLTIAAAVAARGAFARLAAAVGGESLVGVAAVLLGPGVLVYLAGSALIPEREPPADTYYKAFVEDLAAHPDPLSSITFAPVPYGENENIQADKVAPPTWLEGFRSKVTRLREKSRDPLPSGTTEDDLEAFLKAPDAHPKAAVLKPWAEALVAERLTRFRWHWLGTDRGGRDVLSRIIIGSRISLSVGFIVVGINLAIGVLLGAFAGYFRGWADIVISRFTEIVICIPAFFLILAVLSLQTKPHIRNVMLVLGFIGWTSEMRLIRGEFLRLVGLDFVTAGRALGLSDGRVIFRHVLPNAMAPALVAATFGIAGAILTESSLSYLGYGVPPPAASWGSVLNEALGAEKEMWWVTIFPGFMIFVTITAYNLVGEGFRDATDPRLRK